VGNPEQPVLLDDNGIPPPPDPTIYTVTEDSQGRIYVCTNNGVQQLTPAPDGHYDERVFRRRDGLVHDECNTNAQFVDAHDRYWVGTLGGLSMYDPNVATRAQQAQPNPLRFTELRVDGEPLDASADAPRILPAGTREINIAFAVLSGFREQESTYRASWSAWSRRHRRGAPSITGTSAGFRRATTGCRLKGGITPGSSAHRSRSSSPSRRTGSSRPGSASCWGWRLWPSPLAWSCSTTTACTGASGTSNWKSPGAPRKSAPQTSA
jgi:hypothetical protein